MKLEYIFFLGGEWFDYDWLGYNNVFSVGQETRSSAW